jgi:hypothetical protein
LPGRSEIISKRRERYLATDKKIKKAAWQLRIFSWLPWIRLIALANNIGTHNLRTGGDTDLFIVTKKNRLWLTKVCATIILKLTNLRPTPTAAADKFCLSFLVDESALDLSQFRLGNDTYFTYWLSGLVPLYGETKVYTELMSANSWLRAALPNWSVPQAMPRLRFHEAEKVNWLFFMRDAAERVAHTIQTRFMAQNIRELANLDQRVIMSDHVLKLHTIDRREYFKNEHAKRLQQLSI